MVGYCNEHRVPMSDSVAQVRQCGGSNIAVQQP